MAGRLGPPAGRCSTYGLAGPWVPPSCLDSWRPANGSTVEAGCPRETCRLKTGPRRSADTTPGDGPSFNVATAARTGTRERRRNREPNSEIAMAHGRAACGERHLGAAAIVAALSALLVARATYGPRRPHGVRPGGVQPGFSRAPPHDQRLDFDGDRTQRFGRPRRRAHSEGSDWTVGSDETRNSPSARGSGTSSVRGTWPWGSASSWRCTSV